MFILNKKVTLSSLTALKLACLVALTIPSSPFAPLPCRADDGMTDDTTALILKLANNPQLISEEYLNTLLGKPQSSSGQLGGGLSKYWYAPGTKGAKYELTSYQEGDGKATKSFVIFQPAKALSFDDIAETFGKEPLRRFDHEARPTATYSFSPNTSVIFTKPQNTFKVEKVSVNYSGPPLPPPSVFDVMSASDSRKQQILDMHDKGKHWESLPALVQHVKENPNDAEMHYHLARAYKQSCFLNQAVAEYSNALYLCTNNPGSSSHEHLAKQCMEGLAELKVHPMSPDQLNQYHNFSLFQNEQRLKQGRDVSKTMLNAKQSTDPYGYVEEVDPPVTHFTPGTLNPLVSSQAPQALQTSQFAPFSASSPFSPSTALSQSAGLGSNSSSFSQSAFQPAPAPSFTRANTNIVPLKATQGVLNPLPSLQSFHGTAPSSPSALDTLSAPQNDSAGITKLPNGEPF